MGIEKTKQLASKSVYWIGMYVDIENHIKLFYMPSLSANTTMRENNNHEIPGKPWEVLGADTFTLNNKNYLCIVGNRKNCHRCHWHSS